MRGGRAWPVAHAQPFGDELAGHVDEIDVFPHVEQRGAGSQQSYEQFTRFVRPVAVADRAFFEIPQRSRGDRQAEFRGRYGHAQNEVRVGGRFRARSEHYFLFMLGHAGGDHIEGRCLTFAAAARLEHLEEGESRLVVRQRMLGARRGGIKGERDLTADACQQRLQIVDRLRLTFAVWQRRIGQTEHRRDFGLVGR